MKKFKLIGFCLVVLMTAFLPKTSAQTCGATTCPWVIGGAIWISASCATPMTIKVYNTKGTSTTSDDILLATTTLDTDPSGQLYEERLISLPKNFEINQMQVSGQ